MDLLKDFKPTIKETKGETMDTILINYNFTLDLMDSKSKEKMIKNE